MKHAASLFLTLVLTLATPSRISAQQLAEQFKQARVNNPTASFLDISARRAELAKAINPRLLHALSDKHGCVDAEQPAPPIGRMIIPHHYLTGSNGPVNPEEGVAAEPYRRLDDAASHGASRYLATGDHAEAACVASLLANWATANALLDYTSKESSQAWYQVEWTMSSISLAWSVVQSDPAIPAEQRKTVLAWMHKVTEYMFAQNPHDDLSRENNHAYWRALVATSVGILTNDDKLYRKGLEQYARALAQMNPDGSLPKEMMRHENALGYQSFALAPLVLIAELASRQGIDLYDLKENGHTIMDAVHFLQNASANLSIMKKYATEEQRFSLQTSKYPPAWMEFWAKRHPDKQWDALLTKPLFDSNLGGNATLYAAPAK
jgi:poly(beta-D-mannuronate) lyase